MTVQSGGDVRRGWIVWTEMSVPWLLLGDCSPNELPGLGTKVRNGILPLQSLVRPGGKAVNRGYMIVSLQGLRQGKHGSSGLP